MSRAMGPWARHFAAAVAGAAPPSAAAVSNLRVEVGAIFATVDAGDGGICTVSLLAPLIPEGVWTAVVRFARNREALQAGVEARTQSEQLERLLAEDWEEPLVPEPASIAHPCTCDERGDCEHVAAVGHAMAAAIDRDPSLLLRWRGCVEGAAAVGDPWRGGPLPELDGPRPHPPGVILMRLGESGIRIGDADLADVLQRAYAAFAAVPER
jgi:hypothetical protein